MENVTGLKCNTEDMDCVAIRSGRGALYSAVKRDWKVLVERIQVRMLE